MTPFAHHIPSRLCSTLTCYVLVLCLCVTPFLFVSVGNPPSREVIRREVDRDSIPLQDPDVVLAHLPADVRQHLVPVLELHAEGRVRKHFADRTHHLYRVASHARCRSPSPVVERGCHSLMVCGSMVSSRGAVGPRSM